MKELIFNRKRENNDIYYFLNGQEIARSFIVHSSEILNPKRLPEYKVRFSPECETVFGNFVGLDSVINYIDHKICQHFGNMGIYCKIID